MAALPRAGQSATTAPVGTPFSDRLTMVLKALSIGRAPLAAAVGVDKSLISRWCSGQVMPSEHNRARLTQFIASHHAGFSLLDWDLSVDDLAAKLGVAAPAPAKPPPGLADWVPPAMLVEAAANIQLHGASYEGFWRTTRPSSEAPGQFIHDQVLLRRTADGMLGLRLGIMDIFYVGWSIPIGTKLFSIATDATTGTFMFSIFNGITRQRAEVVDGLILTVMRDAGGTPIASKCLLERTGEISDDAVADEARLRELAQSYPLTPAADIPEHIRDHLWSDNGPTAQAAGGDTIMMMALARSMSRGASYEDRKTAPAI
ncbi:Helix-turn-helix transcriptional regulator [Sphingomonas antarctica]|uniref:helix-turn-helix domain-containing protein n=1 Tax=Sphingomonas antarctica TaxID=2040274 RepID=UPI0039E8E4E0